MSAFTHFMEAYWHQHWEEFYEDITDAGKDFYEMEGERKSIELRDEIGSLIREEFFRNYEEYDKKFIKSYKYSSLVSKEEAKKLFSFLSLVTRHPR